MRRSVFDWSNITIMISQQATVTPVIVRADITPKVDLTNWWESQNIGAKVHQVQAGDTLYKLTQLYHVDAAAIATSNGISAVRSSDWHTTRHSSY